MVFFLKLSTPAWALIALFWGILAYAVDFGEPVDSHQWRDVVAIAKAGPHPEGAQIFCTGVVVAPRVVLTAAHCLQEGGRRLGRQEFQQLISGLRVYHGNGEDGGWVHENLMPIARGIIHQNYLRDIRGQADIAILITAEDFPKTVQQQIRPLALDIDLLKNEIRRNQTLKVVGFGHAEQLINSLQTREYFGLKHSGPVRIEGKTADELLVVPGAPVDRFGLYRPGPREGDSGGPAFFKAQDGQYYLTGLVSRATKFNHGPRGMAFSQVRNWICWIEREAQISLREHLDPDTPDFCQMRVPRTEIPDPTVDFLTMCEEPAQRNNSQAYTIYVMKRLLGHSNCSDLHQDLKTRTNLSLDATYINDLTPLFEFTQLERLILRDNSLTSISPLRNHTRLRTLDISYNFVRDSEIIQDLVDSGLWLVGQGRQYNEIVRNEFIRQCSNPNTPHEARTTINAIIDMYGMNRNECVNANYELIRVRELQFYQTQGLTNMDPLRGLSTLERLDLSRQKVSDLSFVEDIDDLRVLILDDNPIFDLSPLLKHRNLTELSVKNLNLEDIKIIEQLPRLRVLHVHGNSISDFGTLEQRERRGIITVHGKEEQNLQGH